MARENGSGIVCEFVGLASATAPRARHGTHPCQGLYWTRRGERPRVAAIATHYNVDFSEHYLGPLFAARGIGFLGWNTRYRGAEDQFILEHALIDIGEGVRWLREVAGVETVVLVGNSGGGSLMAAYQAEAARPTLAAGASKATRAALEKLGQGNLYISLNAHKGRPEVLTDWMDGSVIDETDPTKTDAALDPFNPENGRHIRRRSCGATGRRSGRATSASPTGRSRSSRGSKLRAFRTGSFPCSGCGRICASWTRRSIPPTGLVRAVMPGRRRSPIGARWASDA